MSQPLPRMKIKKRRREREEEEEQEEERTGKNKGQSRDWPGKERSYFCVCGMNVLCLLVMVPILCFSHCTLRR